jgi:hypothetical protein
MTAASLRRCTLDRAESFSQSEAATALQVGREDITFANVSPECVHVEITVHNVGEHRSSPTAAALMAAPFGAFVPWKRLRRLVVPAIEPGGSAILTADVFRPTTAPLGPPDRVRPRQVLIALGAEDDRPRTNTATPPRRARRNFLPPDLLEMLGNRNIHWAGNLNVFIGSQEVERHMAQALRVYPGEVNMAIFVVGSGRDAYRFHVIGEGEDWKATLFDTTEGQTFALDVRRFPPVVEDQWIEAPVSRVMMLALCPPRDCGAGSVAVHVQQRSTGRSAVVEFSLDPKAAGPGCFVV